MDQVLQDKEEELLRQLSMQVVDRCRALFGAKLSMADEAWVGDLRKQLEHDGTELKVQVTLKKDEQVTIFLSMVTSNDLIPISSISFEMPVSKRPSVAH